jgi:hypothetical protein
MAETYAAYVVATLAMPRWDMNVDWTKTGVQGTSRQLRGTVEQGPGDAAYLAQGSGASFPSPWSSGKARQPIRGRRPTSNILEGSHFMVMIEGSGRPSRSSVHGVRRRRRDWVRAEVRCLMCGRLLGRLLGAARPQDNGDRSAGHPVAFLAFRPLDPPGPIVPFAPGLRFRCCLCGGAGALDDIDVFSTYDEAPADADDEEGEYERNRVRRRPGRPPRPVPRERSSGLHTALAAF